jgi:hypothetical protein
MFCSCQSLRDEEWRGILETARAIMLNGFCEDASGQDWPWEDVKPRLDETRSEREQHIQAQRKRLRGKPRRRGVVDD